MSRNKNNNIQSNPYVTGNDRFRRFTDTGKSPVSVGDLKTTKVVEQSTEEKNRILSDFYFPVEERPAYFQREDGQYVEAPDHKTIVRPDTEELISVVTSGYTLAPNKDLIEGFLESVDKSGMKWSIGRGESYSRLNRMRLQVMFDNVTFNDGESDMAFCAYFHNSYDMSESIHYEFGAMRYICTNGMVIMDAIAKSYRKHTSGLNIDDLTTDIHKNVDKLPKVTNRITELIQSDFDRPKAETILSRLGERFATRTVEYNKPSKEDLIRVPELKKAPPNFGLFNGNRKPISAWQAYNRCTWDISHELKPELRPRYQREVGKIFNL